MHANYRVQDHQYNYLVMTTQLLRQLNKDAIANGYNRTIKRGFFDVQEGVDNNEASDRIALDTYPVQCQMAMPHYHKQGVLTMPHVRAVFLVPTISIVEIGKTRDVDTTNPSKVSDEFFETLEWIQVTLDIAGNTWESIPTVRPYAWLDVPEANTYEQNIYKNAEEKFANDSEATIADIESFLAESEKNFLNNMYRNEEEE